MRSPLNHGVIGAALAAAAIAVRSLALAQTPADGPESLLRREMAERRIPGLQVAVVDRGRIAWLRSFGIADLQSASPVTDQTAFSINSCTKAFTGVAIMQLVEAGRIDLAAPVSRYVDGLPDPWQRVTIRQLLTHVSGLPDILSISNPSIGKIVGDGSEETAWARLLTLPLDFPAGERFSYNQTNYVLLGKIIERLTGRLFVEAFADRQFRIAGMPHTGFGDSRDIVPGRAPSYRYVNALDGRPFAEPKLTNAIEIFPPSRRTGSGAHSTTEDLARWIIALQDGRLLRSKAALDTLWTAGTYNDGMPTQWALGWVTRPHGVHKSVLATGGGRAAVVVYPDDSLVVVVLTNLAGAFPEDFIDELAGYYRPDIVRSNPIAMLRIQLRQYGFEKAPEVLADLKRNDPSFQPPETDLNDWAYRLLSQGRAPEALALFKLNVSLYPASANVYDSVAEGYEATGQRELAIRNYQRSLELDPKNTNAIQRLKKLHGGTGRDSM